MHVRAVMGCVALHNGAMRQQGAAMVILDWLSWHEAIVAIPIAAFTDTSSLCSSPGAFTLGKTIVPMFISCEAAVALPLFKPLIQK